MMGVILLAPFTTDHVDAILELLQHNLSHSGGHNSILHVIHTVNIQGPGVNTHHTYTLTLHGICPGLTHHSFKNSLCNRVVQLNLTDLDFEAVRGPDMNEIRVRVSKRGSKEC